MNENNIDETVRTSWAKVIELVENGHPLSSEKTLCFIFAMEIWKQCEGRIQIDFENQCYDALKGKSKYLDLLITTGKDFKAWQLNSSYPRNPKPETLIRHKQGWQFIET